MPCDGVQGRARALLGHAMTWHATPWIVMARIDVACDAMPYNAMARVGRVGR